MHHWRTLATVTASCMIFTGLALAQSAAPVTQPAQGAQPAQTSPDPAKPPTPMAAPSSGSSTMPGTHANQPAKTGTATTDTGGKAITDTLKTPGTSHGMSKAKGIGPSTNGDVRSMQEALKSQGHDPGPIDGMIGPQTQAALKEFQKAQNLEMTGHGDSQTLDKLGVKK